MKSSLLWTSLVALALLGAACSDQNAPVDRAHPDGWVLAHGADPGARGTADGCRSCHGSDLAGGGVAVACLDCHMEGPPFLGHPEDYILTHAAEATPPGAADACRGCHGPDLGGGVSGFACSDCHTAGNPLLAQNRPCMSCHDTPPSEPSAALADRPNRAGAHGAHTALTGSGCRACHDGAGAGTLAHWDSFPPADVAILSPTYQGNRGSALYDFDAASGTGTCANVSCHGGQTTPAWEGGALVVAQDCQACHESGAEPGSPEANSYYSGTHVLHVAIAAAVGFSPPCAACHDPLRLEEGGHFADLATPGFEGDPAGSLRDELSYVVPTCTVGSASPQFAVCHPGQTRVW
ncbi:MAG: CxxxxCH/CxxCH domain c-type cytochrome [Deferrisomatales bacterium]